VLREVLTPSQMKVVTDNAADLARAARGWNAVKVPGSPGTAADLAAAEGHGGPFSQLIHSWFGEKMGGMVAGAAHAVGGAALLGDVTGIGAGLLLAARRAAGLEAIEKLMIEGQLNPQLGRLLEQKAASNPRAPLWRTTARRIVMVGAGIGESAQDAGRR